MPQITIGEFTYDESVLEALSTAEGYEKRLTPADIKSETITNKTFAASWSNYMRTRRSGSFHHYAVQQKQEIHEIAFIVNGLLVCTCGLVADCPAEELNDSVALWKAPGHIQVATRSRVSIFVVKQWVSPDIGLRLHYWCENCGDIGATIPTEAGKVSAIGLKAIRRSHKCSGAK